MPDDTPTPPIPDPNSNTEPNAAPATEPQTDSAQPEEYAQPPANDETHTQAEEVPQQPAAEQAPVGADTSFEPAPEEQIQSPQEEAAPLGSETAEPIQEEPEAETIPNPAEEAETTVTPEPTPAEPQSEAPETIESAQAATQAQAAQTIEGEIIQGAPEKPGDKVEPTEVAQTQQNAPAATTVAPGTKKPVLEKLHPTGKKPDGTPLDGEEKTFAAVGYVGILALLPLLARRDSEFCQHHGRQGLVVAIILIFFWMITSAAGLTVLFVILQIAAIVGGFLLAYKGDWFKIPGIYELSLKLKMDQTKQAPPSSDATTQEPQDQNPQD